MWHDVKEILGIITNVIFLALIVATVTFVLRGWQKTAHLTNFSERIVRVDGRIPYTLQITVIPDFPSAFDTQSGITTPQVATFNAAQAA